MPLRFHATGRADRVVIMRLSMPLRFHATGRADRVVILRLSMPLFRLKKILDL